ncbi:MAG: endopeptidase La [Anaerolineaceae bacterium]|nr:endopeptidase La [Anaerolineaceae bacterium]
MNSKNSHHIDQDDFSAALFQRTEELDAIKNAKADEWGMVQRNAIILENTIVLPHMVSPLFITPGKNLDAILSAQKNSETVIGLIPESIRGNLNLEIGIELVVGKLINLPDGNYSALLQGRRRLQIREIIRTEPFIIVKALIIKKKPTAGSNEIRALIKSTKTLFEQVVLLDSSIPDEAHLYAMNISEPGKLADMVATAISPDKEQRKKVISFIDPVDRLIYINHLLAQELDVLALEDEIQTRVQQEVDKSQREVYLREQVRAIQIELGEGDFWEQEINEYKKKLEEISAPDYVQTAVKNEINKLAINPALAPETGIIRNYIDWLLTLPWENATKDNLSVGHAEKILKKNHYGLKRAKERILEYLAVKKLKGENARQPVLCFLGPPGTGKTSLGKSIAEALGRKFVRISLGGIRDEAEIRGHRRTYIGAMPGRIIQTMKKAEVINPLFMLDEIDKLGNDFRGDPSSALMEVLDQEQNTAFSDHFLEVPYDLSRVMFITTANSMDNIPPALVDRLEIIEFPGYIEEEKLEIGKEFLISKQISENGLSEKEIKFDDQAIRKIIREYTYEAGVRNLDREIGKICRKIAKSKSQGKYLPRSVLEKDVEKYLGPSQYLAFKVESRDDVGVSTAVAWTENGGEIMPVEVLVMDGKGNLQITGKIGDVMQESAQAALSYIKSISDDFGIETENYEKLDIHLHIPEGAIEKDGPSAGVTICTAMLSALTKRKVHLDIGMTGEITLRGKVLPVGGLREKIYAAHRAGLKQLIIPRKNKKDLVDIPKKVKDELKITFVEKMDEIIRVALYD